MATGDEGENGGEMATAEDKGDVPIESAEEQWGDETVANPRRGSSPRCGDDGETEATGNDALLCRGEGEAEATGKRKDASLSKSAASSSETGDKGGEKTDSQSDRWILKKKR